MKEWANSVQQIDKASVIDYDREALAEWVDAFKAVESAAEDARKDVFEEVLSEQVDEGETVGNVRKVTGGKRYVEDERDLIHRIEEAGGDPTEAMSVKVTDAEDVADDLGIDFDEFVEESEYTYFRRES